MTLRMGIPMPASPWDMGMPQGLPAPVGMMLAVMPLEQVNMRVSLRFPFLTALLCQGCARVAGNFILARWAKILCISGGFYKIEDAPRSSDRFCFTPLLPSQVKSAEAHDTESLPDCFLANIPSKDF